MNTITTSAICNFIECARKGYLEILGVTPTKPCEYCDIVSNTERKETENHLNCHSFKQNFSGKKNVAISYNRYVASCDFLIDASQSSFRTPLFFTSRLKSIEYYSRAITFFSIVQSMLEEELATIGYAYSLAEKQCTKLKAKVKYDEVQNAISVLSTISSDTNLPDVIWSKDCSCCHYAKDCFETAKTTGSISLLACMTPLLYSKWVKKGVKSIDHLALHYRPRRRKKKRNPKASHPHQPQLHALAIKENKIIVQVPPEVLSSSQYFVVDIEGDLSQDFFFLIGLLYVNLGKIEFIHYWSENDREQSSVFANFLEYIRKHQNVPIYHFGSFDAKAIHSIAEGIHFNVQDVSERLVNFNSLIYGKIYFPSFGHGLKEIAPIIGARWTAADPRGLQALVWWHKWVETRNTNFKQQLLQYNKEDCLALHSLIQFVAHLTAPNLSVEIDYLDRPRLQSTDRGREIHQTLNDIVKFAHSDYNRNKICFRKTKDTNEIDSILEDSYSVAKRKLPLLKANKVVHARRRLKCPCCHQRIDHANKKIATALIVDLTFGKQGCRRLVTKYIGSKIHCPTCRKYYNPRAIRDLGKGRRYGAGLAAWIVNQRVVLRMPYSSICQCLLEMYDIHLGTATACEFIKESARRHANTERKIIELLRSSPFMHVDETQISIEGVNQYVWVFTNSCYVVLKKKTETRDASIVLETLKGFKGVLITDFYGGYDSMPWKQQKCLSHFIGDLNEDLWKEPNNKELEDFSSNLRKVLLPIFSDIEKHGLKVRFLSKHIRKIDRFYKESINQSNYVSETVQKYQKRLKRYRESMFTFLLLDGIPWNNNTAERAIRHLAVQRKISGAFGKITTPFYLRLLGIAQSCRFQNKSFLRFLISKEFNLSLWQDKKTKYCIKIRHKRKRKQNVEDPRAEENGPSKLPPTAPAPN